MKLLKMFKTMKDTKADKVQPEQSLVENLNRLSEKQLDELADYLEKRQQEKERQKQEEARKAEEERKAEAARKEEEKRKASLKRLSEEEIERDQSGRNMIRNLFKSLDHYRMFKDQRQYVNTCHEKFLQNNEMSNALGWEEVQKLRDILKFLQEDQGFIPAPGTK